jgi:YlmC/YmxH family sporulation protein
MHNQITFCELRCKKVINVADGRYLGHIIDQVIDCVTGVTLGFIVPGRYKLFSFFKGEQIFIPWYNICKIGEDVILVELFEAVSCFNSPSTAGKLDTTVQENNQSTPQEQNAYEQMYNSNHKTSNNVNNAYQTYENFKDGMTYTDSYNTTDN